MLGEKTIDELQCLKRELKAWESMFERKHARKPNKDDVNNASEEIRETYMKYNQLKRGTIDTKKTLVKLKEKEAVEDEIFGKSLNKSSTPVSAEKSVGLKKISPSDYKPIKLCHGQRKAKSSPKSLLPNKIKTDFMESNVEEVKLICTPTRKVDSTTDDLGFNISTSAKNNFFNKPGMMLGKSALAKRMKRRSALTSDWLENSQLGLADDSLNEPESAVNQNNFDECDTFENGSTLKSDLIGEFGDGNCTGPNGLNDGKVTTQNIDSMSDTKNTIEQTKTSLDRTSNEWKNLKSGISNEVILETNGNTDSSFGCDTCLIPGGTKTGKSSSINNSFTTISSSNKNTDSSSMVETSRSSKTDDNAALPSNIANNTDFPSKGQLFKLQTMKRKRVNVTEEVSAKENPEPSTGDDLQVKPSKKRKISDNLNKEGDLEEVGDLEGNDETSGQSEDEQSQTTGKADQRSGSKRSSGLVSENFRALNLKVRRFSRRGQGTNYGAYKRKMWKQKQQANEKADNKKAYWKKNTSNGGGNKRRISSTTTTTCFKCGEDGHWAKDCPRNKPVRAPIPAENWSEPVKAPADLEIADEQWEATEEKLKCLVSDRLPRAHDTPGQAPPAIEPLYQPENGQPIGTPQEVYKALNKLGFDTFRCGQEEAIMQILCGLSSLVVLSTGAGKSLCYQLPAYMYSRRSPCITLVISPLVSLMEDQVVGLPFGLHGVSLNTNMTKPQRLKAVDQICSGKVAVVLVSPEALVGGSSAVGCLPHPSKLPPIAFACIDEAHCVSEWSHNFRPSYLRVCKVLRERFGVRCFLGLTATATRSTALSVCEHLGIVHRPEAIVRGATIPENLNLSVSCDLNKDRAILELLQGSRFSGCDSIIIYCTRREQTERLATYLRTCLQKNPMNTSSCITDQNEGDDEIEKEDKKKRGRKRKSEAAKSKSGKKSIAWHAECYHAGLSGAQRKKVQKKFMAGELRIVVATVAFGMGLDKADVRAVIHYNMPKSFESYVQEIGRAGRDGLPSHCHVFIDPEGKDVRELRRHAHASTVDRNTIKKLVHQIFPTCDCKTLHANMKKKRDNELSQLRESAAGGCRSNSVPDQISDWFDGDDGDIVDHVIEFESQSSKGLGASGEDIVEDGMGEITPQTDANSGQNSANVDSTNSNSNDEGEIVAPENDVTIDNDITEGNDVTNNIVADHANDGRSEVMASQTEESHDNSNRVCGGHEVAIPIAKAVEQLDMKEEAIETQLCYLELHAKRWARLLKSVRSTCTLKFYGGPAHLHYVAQRVPIVTAAVAYVRKRGEFKRNTSSLTFPVVEIVDGMGWDLEPVRRELYGLQWNEGLRLAGETGLSSGHSGIIVEFTDLAFHLQAPGDLTGEERDEVCDFLEDRIMAQERSQLAQLYNVWSTFNARAHPNCWESAEECDKDVDSVLKSIIKAYFESKNDATKLQLEALSTARKNSEFLQSVIPTEEPVNWDAVSRDVRSFITSHGDLELSGRAIARVFHGIDSPCFPASVWGRERRYWRRHLDVDFNLLRKCATKELVKFR